VLWVRVSQRINSSIDLECSSFFFSHVECTMRDFMDEKYLEMTYDAQDSTILLYSTALER
jgi:hypothetical protein